jgi:hypothetical protein
MLAQGWLTLTTGTASPHFQNRCWGVIKCLAQGACGCFAFQSRNRRSCCSSWRQDCAGTASRLRFPRTFSPFSPWHPLGSHGKPLAFKPAYQSLPHPSCPRKYPQSRDTAAAAAAAAAAAQLILEACATPPVRVVDSLDETDRYPACTNETKWYCACQLDQVIPRAPMRSASAARTMSGRYRDCRTRPAGTAHTNATGRKPQSSDAIGWSCD